MQAAMRSRVIRQQVITMESIGQVHIIWRTGSRSIRLNILPFVGLVLHVPSRMSLEQAKEFIQKKQCWIDRARRKVSATEQQRTVFLENSEFRIRNHTLCIRRYAGSTVSSSLRNGNIQVKIPAGCVIEEAEIQEGIRTAILKALRKEAREYLPSRVDQLAREYGYKPGKLSFRNNHSRWGSCTSRGNISLNIHLMRLPPPLVDYVILHELVHTRFPHHQKKFWETLSAIAGNAKELEKELNKYHTQIY